MKRGILGAGNWIVDFVKTIDRFPGPGELCNITGEVKSTGGGPCNVLFDLAAMTDKIPLHAAGRIGNDAAGDFIRSETRRRRINDCYLLTDPAAPTSYTDVMSGLGKRTFFHCRGANAKLSAQDLLSVQCDAKIFYLGYLLLLDTLDQADDAFGTQAARVLAHMRQNMLTVVDFVTESPQKFKTAVKAALPYIDILVINEIEAGNTFDLAVRRPDGTIDLDAMTRCGQAFMAAGIQKMTVLHYPEGAFVITGDGRHHLFDACDLPKAEIVGTNGAGDAFCAGILYGLHEDLALDKTIQIANLCAKYNLLHPTASGGAVKLEEMLRHG